MSRPTLQIAATAPVVSLADCRRADVPHVGGKCANLGELMSLGIDVPPGFAITAEAFRRFVEAAGLSRTIDAALAQVKGAKDPKAYQDASKAIRGAIERTPIPADLAAGIRAAYEDLCKEAGNTRLSVAVRSSATGEDLPEASFAGQQDTYLNVQGADNVVRHVAKCWASLYTPRAIFYREEKGFPHDGVLIAVAVQAMVEAETAGVCFTLDPVTGDPSKCVIESTWGLGEALVGGHVQPDRFVLDKRTGAVLERAIAHKTVAHVPRKGEGLTEERAIPVERSDAPSLTHEEASQICEVARRLEAHFGGPQDVEFAIEWRGRRRIRIVQARPETVWSRKGKPHGGAAATRPARPAPAASASSAAAPAPSQAKPQQAAPPAATSGAKAGAVLAKGQAASPGVRTGRVRVVRSPDEASAKLQPGDILVTRMTNPDWVPYMRIAGAIVTDDGGVTCHAAIVSREMGVPCIVGTRDGTKRLKDGALVTVDAKAGLVLEGQPAAAPAPGHAAAAAAVATAAAPAVLPPVTSTKVYVNLSLPELADKVAAETQADGVGLLRAEHLMLSVGKHPRLLIEEGGEDRMVEAFAEGIRKVAAPFAPRPVVYRFLDFKPDEYLHLPGGQKYELDAGHVGPNPLIGYRGCFRYTKEPDIFRLECRALRKVRDELNLRNVHVMLPFVRTLREFQHAKRILEEEGLRRGPDFKLWIMVEVPATVILIDQFIAEGIDGVSFGTNDLTMLLLGIDRDDASIQEIYDERNPAVLRAMGHVIRACNAAGVTTSVCGQAPSNHPEMVEFLVREGATSMSVNPDKALETRHLVAAIERKVLLDGVRSLRDGKEGGGAPQWTL